MMTSVIHSLNPDTSPILITGAHRTGTTWVGKMLAASGEVAYISEPLNHWHRPGVLKAATPYWYTYICNLNEAEYLSAFQDLFGFRYHLWSEIKSLLSTKDVGRMLRDASIFLRGRLWRQRPLLKDPFAFFSIPWFILRWNCRVVVTIRHPAAFASSLKRLNWSFDFSDLVSQPLLMQEQLEPYRKLIEQVRSSSSIMEQASLLWNIIYTLLEKYQHEHPGIIVARHEDLSLDPIGNYRQLYQQLGLNYTARVKLAIQKSSASENPAELSRKAVHATHLDSRANLQNWKKRLTAEEINTVQRLTKAIAQRYYPDMDWS